MVLTQRVASASTQPRPPSKISKETQAKLSKQTYSYGTLRQTATHAPDGGAIVDYPKGWRFLPDATPEQHEILKKNHRVAEAMRNLHSMPKGALPKGSTTELVHQQNIDRYNASQQKIIDNAHYSLVIAPQIKAQEEAIARKEEEERLAIATLKMRIIELEKKPTPTPTAPEITTSATSYLPFAVVGIVIVVILLFLRRRA